MTHAWNKTYDYQILFKDSSVYFGVENARIILAVNGWVVFHVFDENQKYKEQQFYPTAEIHRIKQLDRP